MSPDTEHAPRRTLPEPFVLLVSGDCGLTEALALRFREERLVHETVQTARRALAIVGQRQPALVLLDTDLPDADGFEVCRRLRGHSRVPIIMVSDRIAEVDRIVGFELGADDYVCKPCSVRELTCRVKAVSRRSWAPPEDTDGFSGPIVVGEIRIDPLTKQVTRNGEPVALKQREYALLWFLVRHPGQPFTRQMLLDAVWGPTFEGTPRTVDVHICELREKLERNRRNPRYLRTAPRFGYLFEDPGGGTAH